MGFSEKQFQSLFTSWIKGEHEAGRQMKSSAFELKCLPKGKRLNFLYGFQPQQLPKLLQVKNGCVYKKLSDADPTLKPYDAQQICFADAYVVIMWYEPRKSKEMVWIDIKTLLLWQKTTGKKSITEDEAKKIGIIYQL